MTRILVIADVHANATALEAVLSTEGSYDATVFLGDAVDNGPHPNAVCEQLREVDLTAGVVGNHDRAVLAAGQVDEPGDDPHARWKAWTYARLSESSLSFLESLDRTTTVSLADQTFRLHHGDFPRPEGHEGPWQTRATPEENPSLFAAIADRYDEDVVLLGHSHFPFEDTVRGTTFVNPGSVGLQRDGWPVNYARYATIEDGSVDFRGVPYDVNAVTQDAEAFDSPYQGVWDRSTPIAGSG